MQISKNDETLPVEYLDIFSNMCKIQSAKVLINSGTLKYETL